MVHAHDGLLFTISEMSEEGEGGGGTYILLLFFILPLFLSLFFSPGWTYYFPSCLYILYTYIYQCVYKMMLILTKTRFFFLLERYTRSGIREKIEIYKFFLFYLKGGRALLPVPLSLIRLSISFFSLFSCILCVFNQIQQKIEG